MMRGPLSDHVLAMLHCRAIHHEWEEAYDWQGKRAPWGTRCVMHCGSCGSDRVEIVAVDGSISARHYDYTPEYKTVSHLPRQEARSLRVAELRRRERASK